MLFRNTLQQCVILLFSLVFSTLLPATVMLAPLAYTESTQEVDITDYIAGVQQKIYKQWPLLGGKKQTDLTIIQFAILKNGDLEHAFVVHSSGNKKQDAIAVKAVKKAAPFEPLPSVIDKPRLNFQESFNGEIDNAESKVLIDLLEERNFKKVDVRSSVVNFAPYIKALQAKIRRNWQPPEDNASKHVRMHFTLGRDGQLLKHHFVDTTGDTAYDESCLEALLKAAPFAPLPKAYTKSSVNVDFVFDYTRK